MFFYVIINLYLVDFPMCNKRVRNKKTGNKKEGSKEREEPERKLWRPCNPWILP